MDDHPDPLAAPWSETNADRPGSAAPEDTTGPRNQEVPEHSVAEIAAAWRRERPDISTGSIEIVTRITRLAKLLADDRNRVLRAATVDSSTLDLLAVIRRSGPPYALTTREIGRRTLITAGAVSQRVARAERDGLVRRAPSPDGRRAVQVSLTDHGHDLVERWVDQILGREEALVGELAADDRKILGELLERLTESVRRQVAAPLPVHEESGRTASSETPGAPDRGGDPSGPTAQPP